MTRNDIRTYYLSSTDYVIPFIGEVKNLLLLMCFRLRYSVHDEIQIEKRCFDFRFLMLIIF